MIGSPPPPAPDHTRGLRQWRRHWRAHLIAIGALLLVWLALWGSVSIPIVALGLLLSVAILIVFPLPPLQFSFGLHPWRALTAACRFAWDVVVASVQVSYLALRRSPPARDVVVVPLASDSDFIQHLTALAVSLIPGSLIIDADPVARTLTVHVLYSSPRPPERFTAEVLAQEDRIRAALGEKR